MMRAKPKSLFSSKFIVFDGDEAVGEIKMSGMREKAEAVVDDRKLKFYREGIFSGPFIVEAEGKRIATAVKPSFIRNYFEIRFGNVSCDLNRKGIFRSAFELVLNGDVIGHLERESIWKRTVKIDLPPEWPAALKVFILWLGLIIWQREAAAAGS